MNEPATALDQARQLPKYFEELLRQGNPELFLREVSAQCAGATVSPQEVLAIVEGLYRERKLAPQLFRLARLGIERRSLGFNETATDATGQVCQLPQPRRQAQRPLKVGTHRRWRIPTGITATAVLLTTLLPGDPQTKARAVPAASSAPPPVATAPAAAQPGELSFAEDRYVVADQEQQVVIAVRRTAGSDGEVGLEWRASGGGARAGRDFALPARGTLLLHSGQVRADLTLKILRNPGRKHIEYFDVHLVRGTGGAAAGELKLATVFLLPGAGAALPQVNQPRVN